VLGRELCICCCPGVWLGACSEEVVGVEGFLNRLPQLQKLGLVVKC
jgi:hypothetical protein